MKSTKPASRCRIQGRACWTFGCNYRVKGDDLKLALNYLVAKAPGPAANAGRVLARVQVAF